MTTFLVACFFTFFLDGVVTGAATDAVVVTTGAAGASLAAGAGVAAKARLEPRMPAATNRADRDVFMVDPLLKTGCWVYLAVGLEPTEGDYRQANLVCP